MLIQSTANNSGLSSNPPSALQRDAIAAAQAAFSQLPNGDALFRQCLASPSPVRDVVKALEQKQAGQKSKKHSKFLVKFQQYTQWMQNFSTVIDVVVQTNAGIGCPVWGPIKFLLEVIPLDINMDSLSSPIAITIPRRGGGTH